jgi:broad specificity phosphatase PhoE
MTLVHLVRHGRAAAGWDTDPDPGLDDLGRAQAEALVARIVERAGAGPLPILSSPLRRCRETAAPLAAAWGVTPVVVDAVREIPSPAGYAMADRVGWLRTAMRGGWAALGEPYTAFRDGVVDAVRSLDTDTVITSHFIAINAVIGACTGDDRLVIASLDNGSITTVEVATGGALRLVAVGHEADTLIR